MRPFHRHHRACRGFALMDVIVGGVMLGIGLGITLTLASRAMASQAQGEKQMVAAWLLDELLAMVLVEGPVEYPHLHPPHGRFDSPFDGFEFDVLLKDLGVGQPFRVTATVSWPRGREERQVQAQTYIAPRFVDPENPIEQRAPLEPIDRIGRWYDDE